MSDLEYRGPATLHLGDGGDEHVPVEVRLSARFEPFDGRFRWAGRTAPHTSLRERVNAGLREAVLSLSEGQEIPVRLSEPDPWGGVRLSGVGPPPWLRPATLP